MNTISLKFSDTVLGYNKCIRILLSSEKQRPGLSGYRQKVTCTFHWKCVFIYYKEVFDVNVFGSFPKVEISAFFSLVS